MQKEISLPARCRSSAQFEKQFPLTLKRRGVEHMHGTVKRRTYLEDVYSVRWDGYKQDVRLHRSMFHIVR